MTGAARYNCGLVTRWAAETTVRSDSLFLWEPDRSTAFVRVEHAPVDRSGEPLQLFHGAHVPSDLEIRLYAAGTKKRIVPDFVYDIGLLLIVSDRVRSAIESIAPSSADFYPATLSTERGVQLAERFWANPKHYAHVMDRTRSRFESRKYDGAEVMRKIHYFAVDRTAVPEYELFVCEEISTPVFSRQLVDCFRLMRATGAIFRGLEGAVWG